MLNPSGDLTGVPAGANYTVKLEGVGSNDIVAWTGEKTDISITGGSTTDAGTITITYVGSDITPPTVTSTNPSDGAANVPVTILITATFSEEMAISSINTVTFSVKNGATTVNGSVTYDSNTKKAIFIPPGNLSYSTTYTATITTGVEDMTGNNMQSDATWRFTTEDPPTTKPSAPTGVNATAGNNQVTITWNAVTGATSYNIYWSTTAGVIKANGTKISNVTSPYIHSGRTNGTTYYYVVTAVNDSGESSEATEVSARPGVTDTTPPTGSVIINNNATYTNSTTVTLTLSAADAGGVSQMCINNENSCSSSSWETYTTSKSWTLTTGDGTKTVYAWFKDGAGNENSTPYTDYITLDITTAPSNPSVTINSGEASTEFTAVTLALSATDNAGIEGYCAKESITTPSSSDSCWITVAPSWDYSAYVSFTLSNGNGIKTAYVWFRDKAGNISAVASDSIILSSSWSAAGSMSTARAYHTATLLSDGKVLVTGGYIGSTLSSAELYDPTSGTWFATGSMSTARTDHTATLLSDGKVLVTGGFNGSGNNSSAELYDSTTGTWSATGNMSSAREHHTATLLLNGKILVVGGFGGSTLLSAELYDPTSGTWSATGSMSSARHSHTATLLSDGKVLVAGGWNGSYLSSAELYDPATGTWSVTNSMSIVRGSHNATVLLNGKVLVTGGHYGIGYLSSAELYDSSMGTWSATDSMSSARYSHTATLLSNGNVLVVGGNPGGGYLSSAELYDPATGTWSVTNSMSTVRAYHNATVLSDGKVLVTGGIGQGGSLSSAELYTP